MPKVNEGENQVTAGIADKFLFLLIRNQRHDHTTTIEDNGYIALFVTNQTLSHFESNHNLSSKHLAIRTIYYKVNKPN